MGAVAQREHEIVERSHGRVGHAHRRAIVAHAVHRPRNLLASRVDGRHHQLVVGRRVRGRRQRIQPVDADERHSEHVGEGLSRCDTYAHAGEESRPDIDGDGIDVTQIETCSRHDELDHRRQVFGVPSFAARLARTEHVRAVDHGDAHGLRSGIDTEHDHSVSSSLVVMTTTLVEVDRPDAGTAPPTRSLSMSR